MEKAIEVSKRIWNAMHEIDIETLRELVHEDAQFVHMGVTVGRDAELDIIEKKGIVYDKIDYEEVTVKQIDSIIVLLNKLKLTAIVGGNEVQNPFVVTEIYSTANDQIKLVSMSYTKIMY